MKIIKRLLFVLCILLYCLILAVAGGRGKELSIIIGFFALFVGGLVFF